MTQREFEMTQMEQGRREALGDIGENVVDLFRWLQREVTRPHEGLIPVTRAEGNIFRVVLEEPGSSVTEIAGAIGQQKSNTSTLIRGLVDKGLMEKRAAMGDGRSFEVYPTALAIQNLADFRKVWAEVLEVGEALTDAEVLIAARVLVVLAEHVRPTVSGGARA